MEVTVWKRLSTRSPAFNSCVSPRACSCQMMDGWVGSGLHPPQHRTSAPSPETTHPENYKSNFPHSGLDLSWG